MSEYARLTSASSGSKTGSNQPSNAFTTSDQLSQDMLREALKAYLKGVTAYQTALRISYTRPNDVAFEEGCTRVLRYGTSPTLGKKGWPVLIVPSLVNKYTILDFSAEVSFARYFSETLGYETFVVDWGVPDRNEKDFGLEQYVLRLFRIVQHICNHEGHPPIVIGYCMGGTLATAMASYCAQIGASKPHALACIATPWNFDAMFGTSFFRALPNPMKFLDTILEGYTAVPAELFQLFFYFQDPNLSFQKFQKLGQELSNGKVPDYKVLLEDWVQDGVDLPIPMARATYLEWYLENRPARGNWSVGGYNVQPESLGIPVWGYASDNDTVVPPDAMRSLMEASFATQIASGGLGHTGTFTSPKAKALVWDALAGWLKGLTVA